MDRVTAMELNGTEVLHNDGETVTQTDDIDPLVYVLIVPIGAADGMQRSGPH